MPLERAQQPGAAFLDEIHVLEAVGAVLPCERRDEGQEALDQLFARARLPGLRPLDDVGDVGRPHRRRHGVDLRQQRVRRLLAALQLLAYRLPLQRRRGSRYAESAGGARKRK